MSTVDDFEYITLKEAAREVIDDYLKSIKGGPPANLYAWMLVQIEYPLLKQTLRYTNNNQSRAAVVLGLSQITLSKKLRQYKLNPTDIE